MMRETSFGFKSPGQKCGLLVTPNIAPTFNRLKKIPKFWDWDAKLCPGDLI